MILKSPGIKCYDFFGNPGQIYVMQSAFLFSSANKGRVDCWKPNLADLASAAIRLRGRKNVAVLDVSANPVTAERFGMDQNTCVKLL